MLEGWGGDLGYAVREYVREHGVTRLGLRVGVKRDLIYQWLRRGVIPSRYEARMRGALGLGGDDPRGKLLRLVLEEYGTDTAARLLGVRLPAIWGWLGADDYPGWLARALVRDFRLANVRGWSDDRVDAFVKKYVDTE